MASTSYIYQMVDTWNNVTETYTAIKMDVTDTASAANSLLLDLQVDGVSKFSVDKTGVITVGGPVPLANFQDNGLSGEVLYNSGVVLASSATGVDITGDLDVTGNLDVAGTSILAGTTEIQSVTDATLTLKSTQTALSGGDPNIGSIDFYGSDASDVGAGVKSSITSAAEAVTGTELVTNGDFSSGSTGWSTGAWGTITGETFEFSPAGTGSQTILFSDGDVFAADTAYRVTYDVISNSLSSASIRFNFGGGDIQTLPQTVGSQSVDVLASSVMGFDLETYSNVSGGTLVLDNISVKELDTLSGAELVTNGTFDDATGWTLPAEWVVSGGVATRTIGVGQDGIRQSGSYPAGPYQISLDMTVVSAFAFWIGFENGGILEAQSPFIGNTSGTKVINIIVPTNCDTLRIQAGVNWEGTIDNVSVQSIGIGAGGDSNLVFSVSDAVTNNNEAMRIKPDGKVGIGTTTPASELDVAGTLTSTGATVNGAATATAVDINASSITTGTALDISDGDALTTGTLANIVSNSSDAGTRSLVTIHNDHASATGTTPLEVINDAGGTALSITGELQVSDGSTIDPSIHGSQPTAGLAFYGAGYEMVYVRAGSPMFALSFNKVALGSGSQYVWTNGSASGGTADTGLKRDSAGVAKVTDGSTGLGALLAGDTTITGGLLAAQSGAGANAFAAGNNAGLTTQGIGAVAVGDQAGETTQGDYSIAIGTQAGETSQGSYSFGIGYRAGWTGQAGNCIALGSFAGQSNQATLATAIGWRAGLSTQGSTATAVGAAAGETTQSAGATAVGYVAGRYSQGVGAVAIGDQAGQGSATPGEEQGDYAVAVGYRAGEIGQTLYGISIGYLAGADNQGQSAFAMGYNAGRYNQESFAIAVGNNAGQHGQSTFAIAIGDQAGQGSATPGDEQGDYAVAIGYQAGEIGQGANGIIISSKGSAVNDTTAGHIHLESSLASLDYDGTDWSFSGGNVGIGVTPTEPLHVVCDSGEYLRIEASSTFNGVCGLGIGTSGNTRAVFEYNPAIGEIRIGNLSGGGYYPVFYSNASEVMRMDTSGNVGIGDQVPTADLHLNADATTTNAFQIEADTVTTGNVIDVVNADALTTGGILDLVSNSADTGTRSLVKIHNDNAAAVNATALEIVQDSTGNAITTDGNTASDTFEATGAYTVAGLPAGTVGQIARITDGDAALAWGATAVNSGAGATPYLVWYNGTNWTILGK